MTANGRHGTPRTGTRPVTPLDVAWVAGFLEGDGTFYRRPGRPPFVQVHQVNREPLDRLQSLLGGTICGIRGVGNHNPKSAWTASGGRAIGIMLTVYPFMSEKRRAQIRKALGYGWKGVALNDTVRSFRG